MSDDFRGKGLDIQFIILCSQPTVLTGIIKWSICLILYMSVLILYWIIILNNTVLYWNILLLWNLVVICLSLFWTMQKQTDNVKQESCAIAKMTAQCAYRPTWVPWKFSGIPDYTHGYYSQHFSWAFVRIDSMNVPTKSEVRSFTHSWDNRGYPKNLDIPQIRPRSLFS